MTMSGSSTRPTTGPRPTTSPAEQPEQLHELQRLFLIEAARHNVLPLDDRRVERFNSDLAGRPQLVQRQPAAAVRRHGPPVRELGHRASRTSPTRSRPRSRCRTAAPNGVIIAQGGAFGGWSLYAKDGKPAYCYNLFGLRRFKVYGDAADPAGEHQVRMEFAYDGGGLGKGGTVALFVDGDQGRRGPHRRDRPDGLLRATRRPTSAATPGRPVTRRLRLGRQRASTAASAGWSSTSTRLPRTSTT